MIGNKTYSLSGSQVAILSCPAVGSSWSKSALAPKVLVVALVVAPAAVAAAVATVELASRPFVERRDSSYTGGWLRKHAITEDVLPRGLSGG